MFGSHGDGRSVILNVNSHIKRGELRCVTPRNFLRGRNAQGNTIHVLKARTQGSSNQRSDRDSELFRARGDVFGEILAVFCVLARMIKTFHFFYCRYELQFLSRIFELIKNLATLNPEKVQGFHGTPLYHCYTLRRGGLD